MHGKTLGRPAGRLRVGGVLRNQSRGGQPAKVVESPARQTHRGSAGVGGQKSIVQKQRHSTERDGMVEAGGRQTADGAHRWNQVEDSTASRSSVLQNRLPAKLHPPLLLLLRNRSRLVAGRRYFLYGSWWRVIDGLLPLPERGQCGGRQTVVFHRSLTFCSQGPGHGRGRG